MQHVVTSKFIPEKELKDRILLTRLMPNNIDEVHQIDNFMKEILKEKGTSKELAVKAVFEKLQRNSRDVYGTLARMWNYTEELNNSRNESMEVDIEILFTCIQRTVLLLCQAISSMELQFFISRNTL